MSLARAAGLVHFLSDELDGTVLDIGCGWAELLLRVVAANPNVHGLGIDRDERAIAHGTELAQERGLTDRVTLVADDARTTAPAHADAVICIGASQVWGQPVEDGQPLDYGSALSEIRTRVSRGGRVVYGEGIWSSPPTPEAVAPLSGRLDELVTIAELTELAVTHGFMPVAVHEAITEEEWDEFESGFSARYARWLAEHAPGDPDATEVRRRAARQRTAYLSGYLRQRPRA